MRIDLRSPARLAALALLPVLPLGLTACGGSSSSGNGSDSGAGGKAKQVSLKLTDTGCTPASASVPAGSVKLEVANPGATKSDEVELKNADGIIMGERENIAPGLSSDFTLDLQPGEYVLNCTFQNEQRDNAKLVVTGAATAKATATDDPTLTKAIGDYKTYVKSETDQLVADTTTFVAALKAGDTQEAKDLFAKTRLHYETVEPIAESFGDLDPDIDARVNDVAKRSDWRGFHRIEQILFVKGTTDGTAGYATELLANVKDLDSRIEALDLQAAQVANGAVGLLDEVANSKINGEEDRYSHTDLSDFQGNLTGARKAFDTLVPALGERDEDALVKDVEARFDAVQEGLDKYKRADDPSGFAPYEELTEADRRRFSQQIAALAEPLSTVAGKLLTSA